MKKTQMMITISGPKQHYFAECNFRDYWRSDAWHKISGDDSLEHFYRTALCEAAARVAQMAANNVLQGVLDDLSTNADVMGEDSYSLYEAVGPDGLTLSATITTYHE